MIYRPACMAIPSAEQRTAVIDLGSNSFRLVVFTAADGWWKRTDEIYEAVRIGAGLGETGELGEEPMQRALHTIDVFAHFCRALGHHRRAPRGDERDPRRAQRQGVRRARARADRAAGPRAVDLAGGALRASRRGELDDDRRRRRPRPRRRLAAARARPRAPAERARRPGRWAPCARRSASSPTAAPSRASSSRRCAPTSTEELGSAPWLPDAGERLVGIGGTVRNLASAAQHLAGQPHVGVQGFVITREALGELVDRLAGVPASERGRVPGIKSARADIILARRRRRADGARGRRLRRGSRSRRQACARASSSSRCSPGRTTCSTTSAATPC